VVLGVGEDADNDVVGWWLLQVKQLCDEAESMRFGD